MSSAPGPVAPSATALGPLRPLPNQAVRLSGGFWAELVAQNRAITLPAGARQLESAGNLANFEAVARGGGYRAGRDDSGAAFPFLDSDVYKWLEAAGWELGRADDDGLRTSADRMIELIARAQRADGYLDTYVQLEHPGAEFADLQWGHELYCAGHLIQAAIAWQRALGDDRLFAIATRLADRIDAELGVRGRAGVDGHPEIEMALVELFRSTGTSRYLQLARRLVENRGHGLLGDGRFGAGYWQDASPARVAREPVGHAVRQLYLDCGCVDVAVETGDQQLLDAVIARWHEMVANRMYLTGGLGSRHRDESFGDPFELPPDRAYAETCAAIASVMLSWRLLLATGDAMYASVAERTLYNGVLAGRSLDGSRFFYVNPLRRRSHHQPAGTGNVSDGRGEWFACACCPPNLMRLFASLPHQLATGDESGLQLHQLTSATFTGNGRVVDASGDQPWDGAFRATVQQTAGDWELAIRIPDWAGALRCELNGVATTTELSAGYLRMSRRWRPGDVVALVADVPVRIIVADPRIDAVRGCVAVERGPLVYCIEQADLPSGVIVDDLAVELNTDPMATVAVEPFPDDGVSVELNLVAARVDDRPLPYATALPEQREYWRGRLRLIPYFAWANREVGGMRVWIPTVRRSR